MIIYDYFINESQIFPKIPEYSEYYQNPKNPLFAKLFWRFQFWTFIFVHFQVLQNSLPKKKFFLMQQNEKLFF